jgi:hypothetical protein
MPDPSISGSAWGGGATTFGVDYEFGEVTAIFNSCLFVENEWEIEPGEGTANSCVVSKYSEAYLINCTFGNSISNSLSGANVVVTSSSRLNVYNSIFYNNQPTEFRLSNYNSYPSFLNVYHSLVEGGEAGISIGGAGTYLHYDPSNIDADPLWDTNSLFPYSLAAGSPCIDAGTMILPPEIDIPETDLAGNPRVWGGGVDMGAYEYGPWVSIYEAAGNQPQAASSLQAYPNPFRDNTMVQYEIQDSGEVRIDVYAMNGNHIANLLHAYRTAGRGTFQWNTVSGGGSYVSPGTYVLKMVVNGKMAGDLTILKMK